MKAGILKTLLVLILGLSFFACDKDEDQSRKASEEEVKKVMSVRNEFNFIQNLINVSLTDVSSEDGGRKSLGRNIIQRIKKFGPCNEISNVIESEESIEITMDFGNGCISEEGLVLKGKIILFIDFTHETSIVYQAEFVDYGESQDGDETAIANGTCSGSFTINFSNGQFDQEINVDLTLTYADGSHVLFSSSGKIESTFEQARVLEYTAEGSFSNSDTFTIAVVKTLIYDFNCAVDLPVEGIEAVTFNGHKTNINYGNGACDDVYTIE